MSDDIETLVSVLRDHIAKMDCDKRVELFGDVASGYCVNCGRSGYDICHCQNDE